MGVGYRWGNAYFWGPGGLFLLVFLAACVAAAFIALAAVAVVAVVVVAVWLALSRRFPRATEALKVTVGLLWGLGLVTSLLAHTVLPWTWAAVAVFVPAGVLALAALPWPTRRTGSVP